MKSQLKALISDNITALEREMTVITQRITYLYWNCDKADTSDSSTWNFNQLNAWKSYKRRVDAKLKKLRAMQVEVKKMTTYTTKKTFTGTINGKNYMASTITTKEV